MLCDCDSRVVVKSLFGRNSDLTLTFAVCHRAINQKSSTILYTDFSPFPMRWCMMLFSIHIFSVCDESDNWE